MLQRRLGSNTNKAHTRVGRVYIIMTRADLSFSVKLYSIVGIVVFLFWLLNRI
jgi:hypothetical protein